MASRRITEELKPCHFGEVALIAAVLAILFYAAVNHLGAPAVQPKCTTQQSK